MPRAQQAFDGLVQMLDLRRWQAGELFAGLLVVQLLMAMFQPATAQRITEADFIDQELRGIGVMPIFGVGELAGATKSMFPAQRNACGKLWVGEMPAEKVVMKLSWTGEVQGLVQQYVWCKLLSVALSNLEYSCLVRL
ncbi:hypothetical protein D3C81_1436030 [compost metagenome]